MYINILGYGITNKALVTLLNKHNIICHIYDDRYENDEIDSIGNSYQSFKKVATLRTNNPNGDANLAIISPGIAPDSAFLSYFKNIMSEYDFIFHIKKGIYSIWISGTNGKTTTTEMLSCMLHAKSGGNIGTPLATLFMQDFNDTQIDVTQCDRMQNQVYDVVSKQDSNAVWVLETSSFTLHYTHYALPNIYILLPLSQDHISWHGGFESYIADKLKPLKYINDAKDPKKHYALIPQELMQYEVAKDIINNTKANVMLYTDSNMLYSYLQCEKKYFECFKEPFRLDFLVAASGMRFGNIDFKINNILEYKIGAYRMEEHVKHGLLFINDSKATNPHAVFSALHTYTQYRIYLILGGDSKGAEMDMLYPFLQENGVKVFSIGKDGGKIASECKAKNIWVKECLSLDKAMESIYSKLREDYLLDSIKDIETCCNDTNKPIVMLSPACASLDQYSSYKERGDRFNMLIEKVFG
ncbi:Mur ligase family protein [Helicobacter bilis]|uniref:UDP-N-acetylmuramoylalanine--D-glutamate ligase n=1 Tax=Helicobacter bilis TaxID=37372 RepID=A0A4V6I6B8_9HELI|nr:Mur ligase family protein [Helicobacter bilis]MCI7410473.1 Mur ligase family protein [Helicobacter bilis]MDD7295919.1 Mur ligase family protein [Helicobacter bilis]MDY4400955.1 Mur ligase family protein [Helicobacter bilis]TLE09634.1 UDP-N-acetylmuramoylalanine--D-glutamate ligase [Helicobacter bilis]TLE12257.1 UDP-N-acetylmuramoylalanine--D-glutamate ligase [Helicobacter bilis]